MRPVVIATDFSDVATDATHYACHLAEQNHSPVILLHTYTIPVTFHENPMPAISLEEGKNMAVSQMQHITDELRHDFPALSISYKVLYGDITDTIKEVIAEDNPWIVIVGNSSSDGSGFWLGSNLLSTLRHTTCPVLAVPLGYKYKKVQKIAFACDFKNVSDWLPAIELTRLVSDAEFHVINVDNGQHAMDEASVEHGYLTEAIHSLNPTYHYLDSSDIDMALEDFVKINDIDWLIVVPHKHSFFEGLFHKSQTKAIVHNARIPILALHEKN